MSKIKLQVGKTYRSRSGNEVKIVGKNDEDWCPYQGSSGNWYNESGRRQAFAEEDPEDLIEELPEARYAFITPDDMKEVTATRYTFTIPDGASQVTVEQVGNRIVVEMVPEKVEPKPGDVMINNWNSVYIFKSDRYNGGYHNCFAWLGKSGNLLIGDWCLPGRPATPEEAQPLWDALKKAGKRWNAEAMQVEGVPECELIMDFLQGYPENVTWTHDQLCWVIDNYLKHKECK